MLRIKRRVPPPVEPVAMNGKVCVVTGGSSGIGFETALGLAHMGATVVITGRTPARIEEAERTLSAAGECHAYSCKFGDFSSVSATADRIRTRFEKIDLLINNAGLWLQDRSLSTDGVEMTLQVNHLAPFLFTRRLLPSVLRAKAARIVTVSSRLHIKTKTLELDDLEFKRRRYSGLAAYNQSKLCNVLFTKELARRHDREALTASAVHPGDVATSVARDNRALQWASDTLGKLYLLTPEEGARTTLYAATAPALASVTGAYYAECATFPSSRMSRDPDLAKRLWELSETMIQSGAAAR